jgi:hypothetical protein
LGGVGRGSPVIGEAAPYVVEGGGEREDIAGDELVGVVGSDRMPVDAVRGDGHLGDGRLRRDDHAVLGESAPRDRPYHLVFREDAEVVEEGVEGRLFGGVAFGGVDRGRDPDPEASSRGER